MSDQMRATPDNVQKIGFNESVVLPSGSLHVQTEVFVRDVAFVRTTVLDGGVVRFVDTQTCPFFGRSLAEVEEFVVAQHRRNVERVRISAGN